MLPFIKLQGGCDLGRRRQMNQYDLTGDYGVGYTSNTNSQFFFDLGDFETIKEYHWNEHILTNGYHALEAWDSVTKRIVRMHWVIVGKGFDHINHNPLDNRRGNLRAATTAENVYNRGKQKTNTSGIIGVYWMKDRKKWRAQIRKCGLSITKEFDTFEEAVKGRLNFESQLFVQFSPQINLFRQYGVKVGDTT